MDGSTIYKTDWTSLYAAINVQLEIKREARLEKHIIFLLQDIQRWLGHFGFGYSLLSTLEKIEIKPKSLEYFQGLEAISTE